LLPFIGWDWSPSDIYFTQGFLQVAVPLNSSRTRLSVTPIPGGSNPIAEIGGQDATGIYDTTIQGQTLLRLNTQLGCWLYDNPCRNTCIDRVAGLLEFHWTSTLKDVNFGEAVFVDSGIDGDPIALSMGNPANRVDVVNCTVGGSFQKGLTNVLPAFTTPLSSGDNKPFDWEAALLFNRYF
jgi:hypothetical protein